MTSRPAALFESNMHQIVYRPTLYITRLKLCPSLYITRLGLCPTLYITRLLQMSYSAPPDSLAVCRGLFLKGGEGREERGWSEFVLCPSKKKRKVGAYGSVVPVTTFIYLKHNNYDIPKLLTRHKQSLRTERPTNFSLSTLMSCSHSTNAQVTQHYHLK